MGQEQYGIENVKPTISIVASVITAGANIDTNKDGDIATLEVLNAVQIVAFSALKKLPNLKALRNELGDLSESEKTEIKQQVEAEVEMPNERTEYLVERVIAVLIEIVDLIVEFQPETEEDLPALERESR